MKMVGSQLALLLGEKHLRRNLRALFRYIAFLIGLVLLYAVLFHVIMERWEGKYHSWLTGVYWTLTVMSTLGFGDITFESDVGRLFSIVVLLSGIVFLLILLPFLFVRHFFAPWLEARLRVRVGRSLPEEMGGHVIICDHDAVGRKLVSKLAAHDIPCFVLEPDAARAAQMHSDEIPVVAGRIDSRGTYEGLRADAARLVLANRDDMTNANIALTVREFAADTPIAAVAVAPDSVDILQLCGCTHVLPLKQRLGETLASRVNAGLTQAHLIGHFHDLQLVEFPVIHTPLVGRTIRESRLREMTGVTIVGVWERGRMTPALADHRLSALSVPVAAGTAAQIDELNTLLVIYGYNENPVVVIGGGAVGRAAAAALRAREVPVHVVERDPAVCAQLEGVPDKVFIGDASDRKLLEKAGIMEAPSVIITTRDDSANVYLTVYCRRLNNELRIVTRVTDEENIEAILRAGADFVLSYATLGAETIFALVQGRESIVLGEGVELFTVEVTAALDGRTLAESGIGARTGLNVIAIGHDGGVSTAISGGTVMRGGSRLITIGSMAGRRAYQEEFGG